MIYGEVDRLGIPYIILEIAGRDWKAIIDTGFNGDVELPLALAGHSNPRFIVSAPSVLAANQTIHEDHFLVDFAFDGKTRECIATFSDGDGILLGTNLLLDYRLVIDFPSQVVTIEQRLPT